MGVDGLTRENVASHLQKYRLYLRRVQGQAGAGGVGGSSAAHGHSHGGTQAAAHTPRTGSGRHHSSSGTHHHNPNSGSSSGLGSGLPAVAAPQPMMGAQMQGGQQPVLSPSPGPGTATASVPGSAGGSGNNAGGHLQVCTSTLFTCTFAVHVRLRQLELDCAVHWLRGWVSSSYLCRAWIHLGCSSSSPTAPKEHSSSNKPHRGSRHCRNSISRACHLRRLGDPWRRHWQRMATTWA